MLNKFLHDNKFFHFGIVFLLAIIGFGLVSFNSPNITNFNIEIGLNNILSLKTPIWLVNLLTYILFIVASFELSFVSKEFSDNFGFIFPSIIFILLGNFILNFSLSVVSAFATVIFIIIIKLIFQLFKKQRIFTDLFYIGILISFLSILKPIFVFLLLLAFIALFILRTFYIKEYIVLIISFLIPFIFIDAFQYFFYDIHLFEWINFNDFKYKFDSNVVNEVFYPLIIFFILSILIIFRYVSGKSVLKKVKTRLFNKWFNLSIITLWLLFFLTSKTEFIYLILVLLSLLLSIIISCFRKKIYIKLALLSLFLLNILIIFIKNYV